MCALVPYGRGADDDGRSPRREEIVEGLPLGARLHPCGRPALQSPRFIFGAEGIVRQEEQAAHIAAHTAARARAFARAFARAHIAERAIAHAAHTAAFTACFLHGQAHKGAPRSEAVASRHVHPPAPRCVLGGHAVHG